MVEPIVSGMIGAICATVSGEVASPIKKKLIAIVEGREIIMPAVLAEARSAAKLIRVINPLPTKKELISCKMNNLSIVV